MTKQPDPGSERTRLRRQIAWEAARLMYQRQESEYYRAKLKAARQVCRGWVKPRDLPSNAEIRHEIQNLARMIEGESRLDRLREMRLEALRLMRRLEKFRPRLIGSVLTGHIRAGSDIDLHLFSDSLEAVCSELDYHGYRYDVERKRIRKQGEEQIYRHIHIEDNFPFELTVYPRGESSRVFISSITGKPIERANLTELEDFLRHTYPDLEIDRHLEETEEAVDRFHLYESLLIPLESVEQNPRYHPEGDVLTHSLQVFDLACDAAPYDEEFLLAALLHDVGKAINQWDHVGGALEALEGYIAPRTEWLIRFHMLAHQIDEGSLGARQHRRLRESEHYRDLILLGECDRGGRVPGLVTTELDEALAYVRALGADWPV